MTDVRSFDVSQFGGDIQRLLVVAAHPDDLETTCGGTLASMTSGAAFRTVSIRVASTTGHASSGRVTTSPRPE